MIPPSVQRYETVRLSGGEVKVTGLTMKQVRECRALEENAADIRAISYATLVPQDEVAAWFESASPADVQAIIAAVMRLSEEPPDAGFPGATAHDAGAGGSGT